MKAHPSSVEIVAGSEESAQRDWRVVAALLLSVAVLAAAVIWLTTAFHHKQEKLAEEWFQRGEQQLRANQPTAAISSLATALSYRRDPRYRLRLAEALSAAGDVEQARAHLLNLWASEPGDGTINLELARLAARDGDSADALRYYQNAIYGMWPRNGDQQRREVRFELVRYLLSVHNFAAATSNLIDLASGLPPDPKLHVDAGQLFVEAGDPERAFSEFDAALRLHPDFRPALQAAANLAWTTGDYEAAARYSQPLAASGDAEMRRIHDVSATVLHMDPYDSRLSTSERIRRTLWAYATVDAQARRCADRVAPDSAAQEAVARLHADAKQATPRGLHRDPDRINPVLDDIFGAVSQIHRVCGPQTTDEAALAALAQTPNGGTR